MKRVTYQGQEYDVPDTMGFKWIAADANGDVYVFSTEPSLEDGVWVYDYGSYLQVFPINRREEAGPLERI